MKARMKKIERIMEVLEWGKQNNVKGKNYFKKILTSDGKCEFVMVPIMVCKKNHNTYHKV
jgi:hypothetical protein